MKYETNTKTARNQAIRDYHKAHPEMSMKEIGRAFGISKQRIFQIIKNGKKEAK